MSERVTEERRPDDGGRLVACRSCGNRVARSARRCPACGVREPTGAGVEVTDAAETPARPPRRERGPLPGLVVSALVGAAAAGVVAVLLRPSPAPVAPPAAPGVEQPATPPSPAIAPEPPREVAPAPPPGRSRARGRTDWIFFFKPGDRLSRMGDDAEVGLVVRTEKAHAFADGTTGPAYLVQVPEGGQRFLDADELERGARIQ